MTKDDFYRISALKEEIDTYEKILGYRKDSPKIGFALPYYSSICGLDPILYRIKDCILNERIEKLVMERLAELKREFSDIQIM